MIVKRNGLKQLNYGRHTQRGMAPKVIRPKDIEYMSKMFSVANGNFNAERDLALSKSDIEQSIGIKIDRAFD